MIVLEIYILWILLLFLIIGWVLVIILDLVCNDDVIIEEIFKFGKFLLLIDFGVCLFSKDIVVFLSLLRLLLVWVFLNIYGFVDLVVGKGVFFWGGLCFLYLFIILGWMFLVFNFNNNVLNLLIIEFIYCFLFLSRLFILVWMFLWLFCILNSFEIMNFCNFFCKSLYKFFLGYYVIFLFKSSVNVSV